MSCANKTPNSPHPAARLVFASQTPLVRPRITDPVPRPRVIGEWAPISRLSKLATYLRRDWLRVLLLIVIGVIVRAPALQGQRIWDDQYLSYDNPFIKSPLLMLEAFRHYLFLDSFSPHYRPVQNISFMIDYFFWNTDTWGFHLTNVLLHVGSGILLFFLVRQLIFSVYLRQVSLAVQEGGLKRVPWISDTAFLIALLWTVHPVHSAAVDYISGRADSLAFFFASAGWLLFLRGRRVTRRSLRAGTYFLAGASGLLALLSREIACIWIVLFLVHVFFIEEKLPSRFRIAVLLCSLGLVALYAGLRQLPEQRPVLPSQAGWRAPVRAVLMLRALGDYGRLMIFPANLHMDRTVFDPTGWQDNKGWRRTIGAEYLSILGLVAIALFLCGSIKKGRWQAARIFGATWFLAAYLPISNVVQLNATVAEHWLYLPSVGFLIFAAGCALELPIRFRPVVAIFAALAIIGLGVRSFVRSNDWVNEETFYKRTFAAGGQSARVILNVGQIYAARGDYGEAEKIFRNVLALVPDYPIAQNNLASILARQGKNEEAEALFALIEKNSMKTRSEYPRTWIGAVNLARVRHTAHDDASALAILERAHKDYPEVWELISLKSEILRQREGPEAALQIVEDFARANWWHQGAALALGRLYAQKGNIDLANTELRRASWLDVHDTEALRLMVQMRLRENKVDEALQIQRRAVARQPDQPSQYVLLSDILEKLGRKGEARATLAKVSQLRALAAAN